MEAGKIASQYMVFTNWTKYRERKRLSEREKKERGRENYTEKKSSKGMDLVKNGWKDKKNEWDSRIEV